MKKKWITRSLFYIAFAAFSIFILYTIGVKVVNNRVADYQQKYINNLYKNIKPGEANYTQSFKRFAVETVGLQNGSIDFTEPIYKESINSSHYGSEVKERFYFDIVVYKTRLHKGKKTRQGYTIYFPKFIYVNNDKEYDLSYRNDGNGNAFFEKGFSKEKREILDSIKVKLSLGFDKAPFIFTNDDRKTEIERAKNSSQISMFAPLYIDDENLKADAKGEAYSTVNYLRFDLAHETKDNPIKNKTIFIIQQNSETNVETTNGRLTGLNLSREKYLIAEDTTPQLYEHKNGKDDVDASIYDKFVRFDLNVALKEFNVKPALIITGVFLLVLVAAYFLFGHRYVMVYVKAKKDAKKLSDKDTGYNINGDIKEAEFKEVTEDKTVETTETTDKKNNLD